MYTLLGCFNAMPVPLGRYRITRALRALCKYTIASALASRREPAESMTSCVLYAQLAILSTALRRVCDANRRCAAAARALARSA